MSRIDYMRNWREKHHPSLTEYFQRYRNNNKQKCKEIHDKYYNRKKLYEPNWVRDKTRAYRFKKRNPLAVEIFKKWSMMINPNFNYHLIKIILLKKFLKIWILYKNEIAIQKVILKIISNKNKFSVLKKFFKIFRDAIYKSKLERRNNPKPVSIVKSIIVNFSF